MIHKFQAGTVNPMTVILDRLRLAEADAAVLATGGEKLLTAFSKLRDAPARGAAIAYVENLADKAGSGSETVVASVPVLTLRLENTDDIPLSKMPS